MSGNRWADTVAGHRARQRDQILDSALGLLGQRGMAGLTMSALAQAAGTSRATLYHYFSDVDAVLVAWVGREVERSVHDLVAEASRIADPVQRLTHLVEAQCHAFASQSHRLGAEHFESEAVSPAVRGEVSVRMAPLRELLAQTVAEGAACGALTSALDPQLAADLLLGILGALRRHLVTGDLAPHAAATTAMALLRRGWISK
ncbi:MAG: TetR/AcrR family transcriptional regulator [Acidimicrobiales bacterium]